jgi:hypothetical protein
MSGFIELLKLHNILDRVVRKIYSSSGLRRKMNSEPTSHFVSNETIIGLEEELQKWVIHHYQCNLEWDKNGLSLTWRSRRTICGQTPF